VSGAAGILKKGSAMIAGLDHLVLTVRDLDATVRFYVDGLQMELREFAEGRQALHFGAQKINLHVAGREFEPKAERPTPGSADLCFLTDRPLDELAQDLDRLGYPVIEGPVARAGAQGPIVSIYLRDPDGNLIELANRP
jgi:catechol 2,3-dioxygenase-like lactoylglutathione lyase family enzyme